MVRRRLVEQPRNVSLPVDQREVSVGGRRNRRGLGRLSHQRTSALGAPASGELEMARRRSGALGRRRCTYVVDLLNDTIYANMPELSAEEPFACIYAGRDVSDEVTISPVEVGAIAFEDDARRGAHLRR